MGLHQQPSSMLKESLLEYLEAASFCVFKSNNKSKQIISESNSCMGYPSALILFSIVDSIGSYFKDNTEISFVIDNECHFNKLGNYQNFYVLNSDYFKLNLSMDFINALYIKFRSELSHNSLLGKNSYLFANNIVFNNNRINNHVLENIAFIEMVEDGINSRYAISIFEFFNICKNAVNAFYNDIDTIVPNSRNGRKFH